MFRNVLIGVDDTPHSLDAITLATVLAEGGARLTLAHVYAGRPTPGRVSNRLFHAFYERAHADSLRLLETARDQSGLDAELIAVGAPSVGHGLHTLAETHEADLLVVGSCGRGPVGRVVIGDDTRASLNGATCAVAIAPRGYHTDRPDLARIGVGYDFTDESHVALLAAREVAAEHGGDHVDLLVVGSRSYGPARRLVFGSTSSHLTRHAHCPLLVLRRATAEPHPRTQTAGAAHPPGSARLPERVRA